MFHNLVNEQIKNIPMPPRIAKLPISDTGFPIPWFVPYDGDKPVPQAADPAKRMKALRIGLCWICGEPLGKFKAFVIGPMCAVNRVTSEPPCHRECAEYAVRACPFLAKPRMKRNPIEIPGKAPAPGIPIDRNPGVCLIWITLGYTTFRDGNGGVLIRLSAEPVETHFYREGREATRGDVLASMESGMPILRDMARQDGGHALDQLERQYHDAMRLLTGVKAYER